jgi:hypothetical protein
MLAFSSNRLSHYANWIEEISALVISWIIVGVVCSETSLLFFCLPPLPHGFSLCLCFLIRAQLPRSRPSLKVALFWALQSLFFPFLPFVISHCPSINLTHISVFPQLCLKIQVNHSAEMLVTTCKTAWCCDPDICDTCFHHCENLKCQLIPFDLLCL